MNSAPIVDSASLPHRASSVVPICAISVDGLATGIFSRIISEGVRTLETAGEIGRDFGVYTVDLVYGFG